MPGPDSAHPSVGSSYVGAAMPRVEDARLLAGRGTYVDDFDPPGVLHAALLRSPHAHARIVSIDADPARCMQGVFAVLTGADLDGVLPVFRAWVDVPGMRPVEQHLLATDRVRFVGEPVSVVVAQDRYVAEDALELIEVEYELLDIVMDVEAAAEPDAVQLHDDVPENTVISAVASFGDPDAAFARADRVFRKRFRGNRQAASPMETRAVLATYEGYSGELSVWITSQAPHVMRMFLVQLLNHPEHKLRVVSPDVGGGFGAKAQIYCEDVLVPFLARRRCVLRRGPSTVRPGAGADRHSNLRPARDVLQWHGGRRRRSGPRDRGGAHPPPGDGG